ncbi:hypothetical protein QBC37DRAFT_399122 [Rhypophila decipiens]|uniref:Uncharacterized protein n=1 Tax=Rhypophila decipiens TaxID=261697 RepID=A0AAN6Y9G8_9PEZI|nr:hypothetical protein QBC37DRAFT_399122 [Rhypophila decipiens]
MDSFASSNVDATSSQETSFEAPRDDDGPVSAVPAAPAPVVEDTATTASDDDDVAEHAADSAQPESTTPPGSPPAAAAAAPKPKPPTAKPPVRYSLFPKIVDYPKFNPPTRGPITAESWARWGPQAPQNQPPAQAQAQAQAQSQTRVEEERKNSKEETGMRKVFISAVRKVKKTFTKARDWIKISGSWGRRTRSKKD